MNSSLLEEKRNIHFIGIAGIGMSGIAHVLSANGFNVTGSDIKQNTISTQLESAGIRVFHDHDQSNISTADLVIYSSAITSLNPELAYAREKNIPTIKRGELLAAFCKTKKTIAVSGTHGKTTTSAMISKILFDNGEDPTLIIGGELDFLLGNARYGSSNLLVVEADESDGTVAQYAPFISVITNIEEEHMDYYKDLNHILETYDIFLQQTTSKAWICTDDPVINDNMHRFSAKKLTTYGTNTSADFRADNIQLSSFESRYDVYHNNNKLATVRLQVLGMHNVLNSLAAFGICYTLGVSRQNICNALSNFTGAKRRFQIKYDHSNITVIDDYAHHPSEIRATLKTVALLPHKRIIVLFQPHRFSRTRDLFKELAESLSIADKVFLTPIYSASEVPIEGVSSHLIEQELETQFNTPVEYIENIESLASHVEKNTASGDILLTIGAGSITSISDELAEGFSRTKNPPVTKNNSLFSLLTKNKAIGCSLSQNTSLRMFCSLKIGGNAEVLAEPANTHELKQLFSFAHTHNYPVRVIGNGTNILVPDKGLPGITIVLSNPFFSFFHQDPDTISLGAAYPLSSLVKETAKRGITGFTFLAGIPGTLGGAIAMNAGAWGCSISQRIESITFIDKTGKEITKQSSSFSFGYRSCPELKNCCVIKARLLAKQGNPAALRKEMKDILHKRKNKYPRYPNAGSIFKNPEGFCAGEIIDTLGLKGYAIGGARISQEHANVIINTGVATAKDVQKLMCTVQKLVKEKTGIKLEPEIILF